MRFNSGYTFLVKNIKYPLLGIDYTECIYQVFKIFRIINNL